MKGFSVHCFDPFTYTHTLIPPILFQSALPLQGKMKIGAKKEYKLLAQNK
jgi:hypothetical protein